MLQLDMYRVYLKDWDISPMYWQNFINSLSARGIEVCDLSKASSDILFNEYNAVRLPKSHFIDFESEEAFCMFKLKFM